MTAKVYYDEGKEMYVITLIECPMGVEDIVVGVFMVDAVIDEVKHEE